MPRREDVERWRALAEGGMTCGQARNALVLMEAVPAMADMLARAAEFADWCRDGARCWPPELRADAERWWAEWHGEVDGAVSDD